MISADDCDSLDQAVGQVLDIFSRARHPTSPFPPSELFSEGWMLRLLLDAHSNGHGGLPVPITANAVWHSEARLSSPFQRSHQGDPYAETHTHVDGVIGQFGFRPGTTAGFHLAPDATQFVVIEAKMGSKLAPGTAKAPWYDQAARNVTAMAWTLAQAGLDPCGLDSLSFVVIAPRDRIDKEPTFASYMDLGSIEDKVRRRIDLYRNDDPGRHRNLVEFRDTVLRRFLKALDLQLVSWEDTIADASLDKRPNLTAFYGRCQAHAGLDRRR
jgi:hypothetical protein